MPKNTQRGSRNNNSEGRNQYSSGMMDMAREKPMATAAAAAAAVGAGVFLWSRRSQISDQLGHLSDQISGWSDKMGSNGSDREFETVGSESAMSASTGIGAASSGKSKGSGRATGSGSRGSKSAMGMGEIGGGNASLGAHSGGGGMNGPSGTGRI